MRAPSLALTTAAAVATTLFSSLTHAATKGIVSDTIVSDAQACSSLCGLNDACLTALYHSKCHECWLLDCALKREPQGFSAVGKSTIKPKPECDAGVVPPVPTECKKADDGGDSGASSSSAISGSASGTVASKTDATGATADKTTSAGAATGTKDSAAGGRLDVWGGSSSLGVVVVLAAGVVAAFA